MIDPETSEDFDESTSFTEDIDTPAIDVLGMPYSKRTYAVMASQVSSDVALPFLRR